MCRRCGLGLRIGIGICQGRYDRPYPTHVSNPAGLPGSEPTRHGLAGLWGCGRPVALGRLVWTDTSDAPLMHGLIAVPNGFVAICDPSGEAVGTACTSPDAIHWSRMPDPSIFTAKGSHPFRAQFLAHGGGVYLAAEGDLSNWGINEPDAILWRSTDGISWTEVPATPILKGRRVGALWYVNGAFLAVSSNGSGGVLISTNGLDWKPMTSGIVPVTGDTSAHAFFGADYDGNRVGDLEYFSGDGVTWKPINRPDAATTSLVSIETVAAGYVATTWNGQTQKDAVIGSPDGVTWSAMYPSPAAMSTIVSFSGRLYGVGSPNSSEVNLLAWSSTDAGRTWEQLTTADGTPMSGRLVVAGIRLLNTTGGAQFGIVEVGAVS